MYYLALFRECLVLLFNVILGFIVPSAGDIRRLNTNKPDDHATFISRSEQLADVII